MSFTRWLRRQHLKGVNRATRIIGIAAAALAAVTLAAPSASAVPITVYGPTYTSGVGGFKGDIYFAGVTNAGMAVGSANKYDASDTHLGTRAFRFDASGTPPIELGNLGTNAGGVSFSFANAINDAGTAVGLVAKFDSSGAISDAPPVRWDASGTAATELGKLGTDTPGNGSSAVAVNDAGTTVGTAHKYDGLGVSRGSRAVRWDASGTAATELGHLGTGFHGVSDFTESNVSAINAAGTAVGWAYKYDGSGAHFDYRAVRWDASGTAATELANLGTDASGNTWSFANDINAAGTAVGDSQKHNDMDYGTRAVRWDASGTAATELGILNTDLYGGTASTALAINDSGTAVGWAWKYDGSGEYLSKRAVRWDASGTAATELESLGGYADTHVVTISDAGIAVGWAYDYEVFGSEYGERALYWGLDGSVVDLNTLIDPASGWTLKAATAISDTGWIGGTGVFDRDGPGEQAAYERLFLMQVPAAAVPEPTTVVLFGIALVGLNATSRRRARRNVAHHLTRGRRATRVVRVAALAAVTLAAPSASAAPVTVYGPTYTPGVGGFQGGSVTGVNDAGTAVGNSAKFNGAGNYQYDRAVRWDGSGSPAIELGNLGTDMNGVTQSYAVAINTAGTAVGYAYKFYGPGSAVYSAVRWDGGGTVATELASGPSIYPSYAIAINDAGVAVGFSGYHYRAVRWDGSGTAATQLALLGDEYNFSYTITYAAAINNAGTAVGAAYLDILGFYFPSVYALRWNESSTHVTVLGNLGTDTSGFANIDALAINDVGTAVGWADKYDGSGVSLGQRAVRWDASGTAATELDLVNVGTWIDGTTSSRAVAINDAGTTVGYAKHIDGSGAWQGTHAVRWDASGTAATELGNLGANGGYTETDVSAINNAGIAVGYAVKHGVGERAVYWGLDAAAVDLNTLIDPLSGWTLNRATAISNTGWIGGSGRFDPDGPGGQESYGRLFLLQVLAASVLPGDFNHDGTVDAADYVVWRKNFSNDQTKYNEWRANFGRTFVAGSGSAGYPLGASVEPLSAAVPEPATVVLFGIGLVGFGAASRRRLRVLFHQPIRASRATRIIGAAAAALAAITLTAPPAAAAPISIYGGPTYTPGVGGFQGGSVAGVNNVGTVVGNAGKYDGAGAVLGSRAVRWDGSGAPAIELGNLGTNASGVPYSYASGINNAGLAVGSADRYEAGVNKGRRAVRWDSAGTAATELRNLGRDASDFTQSQAFDVNDAGSIVGSAAKHSSAGACADLECAVRWNAPGAAATELGGVSELAGFGFGNVARAVNEGGTAVGKVSADVSFAYYTVRWNGSSPYAQVLGNLGEERGTTLSGYWDSAVAINDAGTAVGGSLKVDGMGMWKGVRAVRWNAVGTAATELDNLGMDANSVTQSGAVAINNAGTIVGYADKYDDLGESLGRRAVRWNASGTAATKLGDLGSNDGFTETDAFAINDAGIAIGYAHDYDGSGANLGERAVYWGLDAVAVDLNMLIYPLSGWTLHRATAISDTGWIGGSGEFDPDGAGGQAAYARLFLLQVLATSVLAGDFDHDGTVDAADYVIWRKNFSNDQAKYNEWRANFGRTFVAGSGAADFGELSRAVPSANPLSSAVPEPATVVLFGVGLVGLSAASRRDNRRNFLTAGN